MKNLLQYLKEEKDADELKKIPEYEWNMSKIKNKGNLKSEFAAYTGISSADKLGIDSDGAKLQIGQIKKSLGISASRDFVKVFMQAFSNDNDFNNFAYNKPEHVSIKGKDAIKVQLKSDWGKIAIDNESTSRCIKFWLQAVAVACNVIGPNDDSFHVGINQGKNILYVYLNDL